MPEKVEKIPACFSETTTYTPLRAENSWWEPGPPCKNDCISGHIAAMGIGCFGGRIRWFGRRTSGGLAAGTSAGLAPAAPAALPGTSGVLNGGVSGGLAAGGASGALPGGVSGGLAARVSAGESPFSEAPGFAQMRSSPRLACLPAERSIVCSWDTSAALWRIRGSISAAWSLCCESAPAAETSSIATKTSPLGIYRILPAFS